MIELQDVRIEAGAFVREHVSFLVPAHQYATLMGKTGSGKTTILESICGLRKVRAGKILLGQTDVTNLSPADRGIGYVPQDLALFPTMTVREHLEFPIRLRRWQRSLITSRVLEIAKQLEIEKLLDRRPLGLSGGESQRVALGRAISFQPEVLLLDEPLSALDFDTRDNLQRLLLQINKETGVTVLHVTHNLDESKTLSQQIIHLDLPATRN